MQHAVCLLLLLAGGGGLSSPVTPTLTPDAATPAPDPCEGQPCLNGGSCAPLPVLPETSEPAPAGYACSCGAGYTGPNCEVRRGVRERRPPNGAAPPAGFWLVGRARTSALPAFLVPRYVRTLIRMRKRAPLLWQRSSGKAVLGALGVGVQHLFRCVPRLTPSLLMSQRERERLLV